MNIFFWVKILVSGVVVATASELTKRVPWLGGAIVALPLISILTLVWVYIETKSEVKVSELSWSIFWYVLPTLLFFVLLPFMMRIGVQFWIALALSSVAMIATFAFYRKILRLIGIEF